MSKIIRTEPNSILSAAVEYHGFVYLQGVVAEDSTQDIIGQTRQVLDRIDALLEQHGTDATRLLQAQVWLKNLADRPGFNAVWEEWIAGHGGHPPVRACVQAELVDPKGLVEVMVTACR
ncbi:Translation initiation inhibitor [Granulibacter bethesdensis]|uniref:RidA family protein n=1 Tax=Granulibacter bethesdensis TaxID=364410 RepID=UPI00090A6C19|nr:RidA family protein [Granulibacter bethesdensis]APH56739.1 Translation initiation inhibitor [Granulibacter bethesdensis]